MERFKFLGYVIFAAMLTGSAQARTPEIAIKYSPTLDSACAFIRGYSIKDEWKTELISRQQEFKELWDAQGPKMIAAAERITGKQILKVC